MTIESKQFAWILLVPEQLQLHTKGSFSLGGSIQSQQYSRLISDSFLDDGYKISILSDEFLFEFLETCTF